MLNTVTRVVAVLALAGAAYLGWSYKSLRAENAALTQAVQTLSADLESARTLRKQDQAVASRYAKSVAKLTTNQRLTDAKLKKALDENARWADENVPPDVLRALGVQLPADAK